MNIEKGKISDSQFILLIATTTGGSILAFSFIDTITGRDTWLVVLSAYIISTPFVIGYAFLAKRFPGNNIIQINDIIYGPYLGKLISIIYISYFLLLFSLNIRDISNFYIGLIIPETPILAFLILFVLISAYAIQKGVEVISRINIPIFVVIILEIAVTSILLFNKMDFTNLLPVFDIPLKTYIQGTHIMIAISFCNDLLFFLMIMPYSNNYKSLVKNTYYGSSIAALIFFIVSIRNITVLGSSSSLLISASYQAARLIDIGNIITRIDLFVAVAVTLNMFIKVCVYYYATVAGVSSILNLHSYSTLILPIGCIAIILAIIVYDNEIIHFFSAQNYHSVLVFPIQFIIPPLSLFIAKIRGLPKQIGSESE
jgi:spore germination protein KB